MRVKVSLGMEAPEAMAMIEMNQPRVTLALLEFALLPSNSWQWIFSHRSSTICGKSGALVKVLDL